MIQAGIEAAKQISPNVYLIVIMALFIAKEIIAMTFKGVSVLRGLSNGKGKLDRDPAFTLKWDIHTQETHDAKLIGERVEGGMGKLLLESTKQTLESKLQTAEIKKQTGVLEKIRQNGSSKK